MALRIKVAEKEGGLFTLTLTGPLDAATYAQFERVLAPIMVATTKAIVLDMDGVDYISSMGIGSIFKVRNFAKDKNAKFVMVNLQPPVKKVFDTVQAMPPEAIFSSLEEIDAYLSDIQKGFQEKDKPYSL